MKKKVCFIILIFLMFIIGVEAKNINMPFDMAKELANNYMDNSSKHEYYLIKGNDLYFGFDEENNIIKNNNFLKGGLVNLQEYKISFFKNYSYLKTGVNYWTMTNVSEKYYAITAFKENLYTIDKKNEARINEYVKKDTYVSGSGTYRDPWLFNKLNTIVFVSTDESKGSINPVKTYALDGQKLAIGIHPELGYEYASNTCNKALDISGGIYFQEGEIKDDIYCEVSFKEKTYTLTYDNNGGSGCTSKQITYNSVYGDLCTPVKEGFKFLGWYSDINNDEEITASTVVKQTEEHTIYAKWQNNVTCSSLASSIQCNTTKTDKIINYTGACEFSCEDSTKNVWKIKFKNSGELTLNDDISLDIFAVGGGGGGGTSCSSDPGFYCQKQGAGGGGYTKTYLKQDIKAGKYHIEVGAGGAINKDGTMSYFGSNTTYFADGGKGATGNNGAAGGSGGGSGSCPICNGYDWGGCVNYSSERGSGGKYGTDGTACSGLSGGKGQGYTTCEFGLGTTSGCDSGVTAYSQGGNGSSSLANSGNGGDVGGSGSSGIVIIRNNLVNDITVNNKIIGTYTGTIKTIDEGNNNWKIKFLSSGELILNTSINIDLFLVGGGGGGGSTCTTSGAGFYCQSGGGGAGGYTKTYLNKTIESGTYWIEIGSGGSIGESGGTTYFGSTNTYSIAGGTGASNTGGSGGSGGGSGSCDICNSYDWSGCANYSTTSGKGGSFGTNGTGCSGYSISNSGGKGQESTTCEFGEGTTSACYSGVTAYSQGGMGASSISNSGNGGNVGNVGNSGILIIRNKR